MAKADLQLQVKNKHDQQNFNQDLLDNLEKVSNSRLDYWSFKGNSKREHGHGFFQYPAMMVPQMVRTFLDEICAADPKIERVFDPFAGSGTLITEAMNKGLSAFAVDINPLAILLCKTKAGPFYTQSLEKKINSLLERIDADQFNHIEVDFPGLDKWFRIDVQIGLSKIKRAILAEPSLWARRFFWVSMAEAVRVNGNSRTSTFKLHTRTQEDITIKDFNSILTFQKALHRNFKYMNSHREFLQNKNLLKYGRYIKDITIRLDDTRKLSSKFDGTCDLVVTSPPYGDNDTTVPYGQYSFLPLQWIDLKDIEKGIPESILSTTNRIDSNSLGGKKVFSSGIREFLCAKSKTLESILEELDKLPADRSKRVMAFFRDLEESIKPISNILRPGGLMVWTIGNRMVGGHRIPLDKILSEILEDYNISCVTQLQRNIANKRMAQKNRTTDTMSTETISIFQK